MRKVFPFLLCGMFAAVPTITTGCREKTVSTETKTVRESDGDVKQTQTTVTQKPDGTQRQTTVEKEVNR